MATILKCFSILSFLIHNKIQKIQFKKSEVFKDNSELTFFNENTPENETPKIIFLVGNNGSGKTSILNYLYNGLAEGRKGFYGSTKLKKGTKFDIFITNENPQIEVSVEQSGIRSNRYPENIKIIFDEVNTTFNIEKINVPQENVILNDFICSYFCFFGQNVVSCSIIKKEKIKILSFYLSMYCAIL